MADRTAARLFENGLQVRAIEASGRTATARMKADRSRQARRTALRPTPSDRAASATRGEAQRPVIVPPAPIEAFADVEALSSVVDASAAHLDDAVRPDLSLPDAQRIARIDRDRWIGYGRAREILAERERILRSERRQRPDNLLIIGASNHGKTAIARRFLSGVRVPETPAATYATIPAALIQAPNGPRIAHVLTAIRAALGQPPGRRETIAQQRAETDRIMQTVGLRLLLIDDLHDIRGGAAPASKLVQLREVGSVLGESLGCFATREIAYVLRQ